MQTLKEQRMASQPKDDVRRNVRAHYGKIAETAKLNPAEFQYSSCCGPTSQNAGSMESESCCGGSKDVSAEQISKALGYSEMDINNSPAGSNMGLGCGNPKAIAALKPGEVVLDLGSGGGFDCFLASREVGETGQVIGVDMTPDMLEKARQNLVTSGVTNVEFRLGEIEHLPVADASIDVIISNCVINLSAYKQQVFDDAFRVLKPGGRLAFSDVVAKAPLPESLKNSVTMIASCIGGAETIENLVTMLKKSGFKNVRIQPVDDSSEFIRTWIPGQNIEDYVISAMIEAIKSVKGENKNE
jgi:arsenite methyltransferase